MLMSIKDKWMVEINGSMLMDIIDDLIYVHNGLEKEKHPLSQELIFPITVLQNHLDNNFTRSFTGGES